MRTKLQKCFPMIKTRQAILDEIDGNTKMHSVFYSWEKKQKEEFLDFCTGVKGIKLLYDSFFKQIMNPETAPRRLEEFISAAIGEKVKILHVLPNESARIAAEDSLLIMDMVVQLTDGSLANVEIQKLGYRFSGQRSACYSADLLLRQYKRLREEKGKSFTYKDVKNVYTIVLFEKSEKKYHEFSEQIYVHHMEQKSDTGIQADLLQKYTFICLDIFRDVIQNKDGEIENNLEKWLLFLSEDNPERIMQLVEKVPEFKALYEEVYTMCQNVERMMEMFSKELEILDKNTVRYMIDEMQEELEGQKKEIDAKNREIKGQQNKLEDQSRIIHEDAKRIEEMNQLLKKREEKIQELMEQLEKSSR